jgi:hypothetical protein
MKNKAIITLTFTTSGWYRCDGLPRPIKIGGGLQPGDLGCEACPYYINCEMSHVAALAKFVKDLDAIDDWCKTTNGNCTLVRGQKTYGWWGRSVGDYPLPKGMKKEDLGKCDHAIKVKGTTWEIGLCKVGMVKNEVTGIMEDGGYRLAYDFYGSSGRPLQEAIGKDGEKFLQGYGIALAHRTAAQQGYYDVQTCPLPNGDVEVKVQVGV